MKQFLPSALVFLVGLTVAACGHSAGTGDDAAPPDHIATDVAVDAPDSAPLDAPDVPDAVDTADASDDAPPPSDASPCPSDRMLCAGACIDPQTDPLNCATCGHACVPGSECNASRCLAGCPADRTTCGGACVNTDTDVANCGVCGNACPRGGICLGGMCGCPSGYTVCNLSACVDLQSDVANCGACGNACAAGELCQGGRCAPLRCDAPWVMCSSGGSSVCANLQTDSANCGACGNACFGGLVCTAGVCRCSTGQSFCGGQCIDSDADPLNCGACGNRCNAGTPCVGGVCGCNAPYLLCSGVCVDGRIDAQHCGACANACPTGATCGGATCACPLGQVPCDGRCVDPLSDAANCSACGHACGVGGVCTAGACHCPVQCGGTCVDANNDRNNCGACGNACATGTPCIDGYCGLLMAGLGGDAGFGANRLAVGDDVSTCNMPDSVGPVDLTPVSSAGLFFYGTAYRQLCVSNNGNVALTDSGTGLWEYTPGFPGLGVPLIAPWYGDVDTRGGPASDPTADAVYWDVRPGQFVATWNRVGYYNSHDTLQNTFQLVLRARDDVAPGDFDVEFRYRQCQWTTGDAEGGTNGLGGTPAVAGFDVGDRTRAVTLPGSRTMSVLNLCTTSNVGVPGLWRYQVRSGIVGG